MILKLVIAIHVIPLELEMPSWSLTGAKQSLPDGWRRHKAPKIGSLTALSKRAAIFRAEGEDGQETLIPSLTVTIFTRGQAGRERE